MSSDNNCAICLEGLATAPICSVFPCGHVFHETCWHGWVASRLGSRQQTKCVMCNRLSAGSCKLFLAIGALQQQVLEDGEGDLSSVSSASSEEAEEAGETDSQSGQEESASNHDARGNSQETAIDLEDSEPSSSTMAKPSQPKRKKHRRTKESNDREEEEEEEEGNVRDSEFQYKE